MGNCNFASVVCRLRGGNQARGIIMSVQMELFTIGVMERDYHDLQFQQSIKCLFFLTEIYIYK